MKRCMVAMDRDIPDICPYEKVICCKYCSIQECEGRCPYHNDDKRCWWED